MLPQDIAIGTTDDVLEFFRYLVFVERLNLHPDTPFADYVEQGTDKPTFAPAQVVQLDRQMEQAFQVAARCDADLYKILAGVFYEYDFSQINVSEWHGLADIAFPHRYSPCKVCGETFAQGKIDHGEILCSSDCWNRARLERGLENYVE